MSKTMDRRILRSKQLLREALLELTQDKGFEEISVSELTERAGLNRGTFYLHYQDLQDFYTQSAAEIINEFHKITKDLDYSHITTPFVDPPAELIQPFEYLAENQWIFKLFMGPKGDPSFPQLLRDSICQQFYRSYHTKHHGEVVVPVFQQYLFAYTSSAYVGTIQFWFEQELNLTPKSLAVLFSQIAHTGSSEVIDFNHTYE